MSSIEALTARRRVLEAELQTEVLAARAKGCSWATIAQALGCSKQNAHKRYGPRSSTAAQDPLSDPLFDVG